MAVINGSNDASLSPNSSEEVESQHGTPATRISPFSPEAREGLKTGGHGIVRSKIPPAFILTHVQSNSSPKGKIGDRPSPLVSHDPFISAPLFGSATRSSTDASKLSPVASTFTPSGFRENEASAGSLGQVELPIASLSLNTSSNASPNPALSIQAGHKDTNSLKLNTLSAADLSSTAQSASSPASSVSLDIAHQKIGQFSTDDGTSRSLMVSQLSPRTSAQEIWELFNQNVFSSLSAVVLTELVSNGIVYVRFADIRDSDKAWITIRDVRPTWSVQHISAPQFALKHQVANPQTPFLSRFEAQILVTANSLGANQRIEVGKFGSSVKDRLEMYGTITAYEISMTKVSIPVFRAEYCNVDAVNLALTNLDGCDIGLCYLSVARYEPDLEGPSSKRHGPLIIRQKDAGPAATFKNMDYPEVSALSSVYSITYSGLPQSGRAPNSLTYRRQDLGGQHAPSPLNTFYQDSPSRGTLQSPIWSPMGNGSIDFSLQSPLYSPYSPGAIGQERGTPLSSNPRPGYYNPQRANAKASGRDYASGHHNVVDVDRIRQGIDVRTTIMLRNIPNKVDQSMLKDIVDETSLGKYDFMYLRIDFANNCNVGYAFINFEDPYYIIDFVHARAGHRWNRYNSDKVAEVSYATIQGKDCLVQKFRNSSVMLEHPSFRPKIFYTGVGLQVGTEEHFPGPDNPSKMRRSIENAEHVGLFAPRAGQNFRDEQRRRRSQYDRGTRLAEIEDSYGMDHRTYRNDNRAFFPTMPYGMCHEPFHVGYGTPIY